jgi:site-specific DNA recombinase
MNATQPEAVGYLRLSDMRTEDALEGREAKLRALADRLGWHMIEVIIENDIIIVDGTPRPKPASAWKRKRVTLPSGYVALRVIRPKFRDELLPAVMSGVNVLTEYGDRIARDHRDGEDFLEAIEIGKASMRSLDGRLVLTEGGTDKERDDFRDELKFAAREGRVKSERAANGRERWAGRSYQGGRRPFGYRVEQGTEMYHRNLVIDEVEAAVIREAADAVLFHDTSLRSLARDLRRRGIRTVTGKPFDAERLREALTKPTLAGLQRHKDELRQAPWPAILEDRDTWEALVTKLNDDQRRTNGSRANEPRWLLSVFGTCGICGAHMKVSGTEKNRYYMCSSQNGCATRSRAADSDEFIANLVIERLSQPDAAELLKPPPRNWADVAGLKAEARKLEAAGARQAAMHAVGDITDDELRSGSKTRQARMAVIESQIAASESAPDPLADFRGKPAQTVWDSLSIARQRRVARLLLRVRFMPRPPRAPFDSGNLDVTWNTGV